MNNSNLSARKSFQVPKPEAGLAEWTSKIKALQRQVDADEEAEQRRLEEEIAASRLARLRRGQSIGNSTSLDIMDTSRSKESSESPRREEETTDAPSDLETEKQSDALLTRSGTGSLTNAFHVSADSAARMPSSTRTRSLQSQSRPEPMSLAQFMGGRAAGPRLNKHSPQQDPHDPTQFKQHSRSDAPHPVFGRGGIAMPGMIGRSNNSANLDRISEPHIPMASATELGHASSVTSHPHVVKDHTVSMPIPGAGTTLSHTRTSPEAGAGPAASSTFPLVSVAKSSSLPAAASPTPSLAGTPRRQQLTAAASMPARSTSPKQQDSRTSPSPAAHNAPASVPSLARQVLPAPKPLVHRPSNGAPTALSPAFLKPPPQKDPTPSLSRLQGRGFVQSMVQVSSQLTNSPPPNSPPSEKSRPTKRASILDRWQPSSPSPPPQTSPKAPPIRKSKTFDVAQRSPESDQPVSFKPTRFIHPSTAVSQESASSLNDQNTPGMAAFITGPGLGSATTMVVYKSSPIEEETLPIADELGLHFNRSSTVWSSPSEPPGGIGRPLAHPTKDRAKIPRKGQNAKSKSSHSWDSKDHELANTNALSSSPSTRQEPMIIRPANTRPVPNPEPELSTGRAVKDMVGARALPGLVMTDLRPSCLDASMTTRDLSPKSSTSLEDSSKRSRLSPTSHSQSPKQVGDTGSFGTSPSDKAASPVKHSRIPSTGNRATVMDVHQAFSQQGQQDQPPTSFPTPPSSPKFTPSQIASRPHNTIPPALQAEKRKSSYERYSAIILPPLPEEATPTPTPHGTLSRDAKLILACEGGNMDLPTASNLHPDASSVSTPIRIQAEPIELPLRHVEISKLVEIDSSPKPRSVLERQTISVEVMSIVGTSASPITQDTAIFYDSEILAIIHRYKTNTTGLVSNSVWSWQGKQSHLGEREDRKLQDLAKRYSTSINSTRQLSEPPELVDLLGGRLAIRQGSRTHWSPENTAMHLIRSFSGVIYIDEYDLDIRNLCSGFSYCLSVLDSVYVWHGRGSTSEERKAALNYAHSLCARPDNIQELVEGENDDDEMFWMILGDDEFSNADHWRWRRESNVRDPRLWRVEQSENPVVRIDHITEEKNFQESVYIIDCIWESFVVVGRLARGKRQTIFLAISVAKDLAKHSSLSRPFCPPVHVIVLPTQLPSDLRMSIRGIDETLLNEGDVPEHMNLLTYENALKDLDTDLWDPKKLRDLTMLPLGVDPSAFH